MSREETQNDTYNPVPIAARLSTGIHRVDIHYQDDARDDIRIIHPVAQ
jgi:hypothetical protein